MGKFKEFILESLDKIEESVVSPYVGQMINSIGKNVGSYQVTFVNDKIVKLKGPSGEKTMTRGEFENEFSLAGEVANESLEKDDDCDDDCEDDCEDEN